MRYDYGYGRPQILENLNDAVIHNADGPDEGIRQGRGRFGASGCDVEVLFTDLDLRMREEIERWPVIVGCMAWLTNPHIIGAMSTREAVSVLVQKEDFLRPDVGGWTKDKLRQSYAQVPGFNRYSAGAAYNFASDPESPAIRCVGRAAEKKEVPPRMHHKFLVFCKLEGFPEEEGQDRMFLPQCVWTGSFNATTNGVRSLENAVIIRNGLVAESYYQEWKSLFGISEPLDWQHRHVYAEHRIGT